MCAGGVRKRLFARMITGNVTKLPTVKKRRLITSLSMGAVLAASTYMVPAQQSFKERFFEHNSSVAAFQPSRPTPLVEADPRLSQYARISFSDEYATGSTRTVSYGNGRGIGIIGWNRFEFDYYPPPYIQHNSHAHDGFGDTAVLAKYRIASGKFERRDFIVTAILGHTFATGRYNNGAATDIWNPMVAGGIGFLKRFDVESSLGGSMPTGKIATQGRSIAWSSLVQEHAAGHVWLELENNATFYFASSHDGKMQNFATPAAFYVARRKDWKPTHPFLVFVGGMQIATSGFHTYNHNTIFEMRILF